MLKLTTPTLHSFRSRLGRLWRCVRGQVVQNHNTTLRTMRIMQNQRQLNNGTPRPCSKGQMRRRRLDLSWQLRIIQAQSISRSRSRLDFESCTARGQRFRRNQPIPTRLRSEAIMTIRRGNGIYSLEAQSHGSDWHQTPCFCNMPVGRFPDPSQGPFQLRRKIRSK
ncbi:hypothetical protein BC567DRAFT_18900 [Phyllosticta citribraziliensis]